MLKKKYLYLGSDVKFIRTLCVCNPGTTNCCFDNNTCKYFNLNRYNFLMCKSIDVKKRTLYELCMYINSLHQIKQLTKYRYIPHVISEKV